MCGIKRATGNPQCQKKKPSTVWKRSINRVTCRLCSVIYIFRCFIALANFLTSSHPPPFLFRPRPPSLLSASPLSDRAYLQASIIFQQLREEKPVTHQRLHYEKKTDTPLFESGDKSTQRQTYQLAFNALKCMMTPHVNLI